MRGLVTITTDASFDLVLKFGAFAFWAKSDDFKTTKSGVFKSKCINSDDAEAKCIINALKVVLLAHSSAFMESVSSQSLYKN